MANRQTKIIGGNGTDSLAFTLDPGLFQYVQSVLVEVDNTAGPDVRPTLSVQTVNADPIADKRQGEAIPAGDTGRATWALRLADETASSGGEVAQPSCFLITPGSQLIANGTLTTIDFDDFAVPPMFDQGDMHDNIVNPSRITIPLAGKYVIGGHSTWDVESRLNLRQGIFKVNGAQLGEPVAFTPGATGGSLGGFCLAYDWSRIMDLVAGDYVQLAVFQNSGVGVTLTAAEFWATRIGP